MDAARRDSSAFRQETGKAGVWQGQGTDKRMTLGCTSATSILLMKRVHVNSRRPQGRRGLDGVVFGLADQSWNGLYTVARSLKWNGT